jgi:FkbH-like protein
MPRSFDTLLSRLPEPAATAVREAVDSSTWINVRRALSAFDKCPIDQRGPDTTIRILSTFNTESIEPALRLGLGCMPCRASLKFAPIDTVAQQLLDRNSIVYTEPCDATVVLWRLDELLPDLYFSFSTGGLEEQKRKCDELKDRIANVVKAYSHAGSTPLFLSTLLVPPHFAGSVLQSQLGWGVSSLIAEINTRIFQLGALNPKIRVVDLNRWSATEGNAYYDIQMDFLARQPFTVRAAISLGIYLARNLRPLFVPRKKVLVVDLDNTVWGGILGEDGVHGLKLGHDFPDNVFLRIQREIRELKAQGVLLLLATKNDESEVRLAMDSIPHMLLKWQDFACHKVNFAHKYLNLREAANELGLGTNSFALLDDSAYEREQMKVFNPEVLILNERSDALHILMSLLHSDAFDSYHITDEDRQRHQDYELRSARSLEHREGSVEEFLTSLGLQAKLEPVHSGNIDRVVQMLGKTNQFNLTTQRHGLQELHHILALPGCLGFTLRLIDKFGDQGIVGILLAVSQDQGTTLYIDSFLISCRAIGRGVEDVLWAALMNHAACNDVCRILGHYIPTAKNGLVATLYERFGLTRLESTASDKWFALEGIRPTSFPNWIEVEEIGYERDRRVATASH